MLAINVGETQDEVSDFMNGHNYTFTVLLDTDDSVKDAYGVWGIPSRSSWIGGERSTTSPAGQMMSRTRCASCWRSRQSSLASPRVSLYNGTQEGMMISSYLLCWRHRATVPSLTIVLVEVSP